MRFTQYICVSALFVFGWWESSLATPTITQQPQDVTRDAGNFGNVFNVLATAGSGFLRFQWYRGPRGDTSNPIGSNLSSYHITRPVDSDEGSYWVRVSDDTGSVDSLAADLTIIPRKTSNSEATDGLFVDRVRVSWRPAFGATEYLIYRDINWWDDGQLIGVTSDLYFDDFTAVPGQNYNYWVESRDVDGEFSDDRSRREGFRATVGLNGVELPIEDRNAFVFSNAGDRLFVTTDHGLVYTYHIANRQIEQVFHLDERVNGLDIDPTDSFLLVSRMARNLVDATEGAIFKIELSTEAISLLTFELEEHEDETYDVGIANSTTALVISSYSGGGSSTPIRILNPATGVYSLPPVSDFREPPVLFRNRQRTIFATIEGHISSGPWTNYNVATGTFSAKVNTNIHASFGAINSDASIVVASGEVQDSTGVLITNLGVRNGTVFSSYDNLLFAYDGGVVRVFETANWTENTPINFSSSGNDNFLSLGHDKVQLSPDGSQLAVAKGRG
ncbi:MAG: hypothetical protein AAF585_03945, partial [Verrucomicrobiota bacterium]